MTIYIWIFYLTYGDCRVTFATRLIRAYIGTLWYATSGVTCGLIKKKMTFFQTCLLNLLDILVGGYPNIIVLCILYARL